MLGIRIAILRLSKGWSQAELARRIGVSASAIGMYEQGRREPSLGLLVRLAQEFGVTTDYLLINYGGGLFTSLLIDAGKDPIAFAVEDKWPYIVIIAITIWMTFGYQTLIMYAGLLQIPKSLYEAAQLDGANFWHQTLFITIPNMKNYFVLVCISLVTANLQMFEIPFMVTGGGPLESTLTPVMYLYNSFRDPGRPQNVTIAGALLVMILIMVINIIVFKTVRSEKSGE